MTHNSVDCKWPGVDSSLIGILDVVPGVLNLFGALDLLNSLLKPRDSFLDQCFLNVQNQIYRITKQTKYIEMLLLKYLKIKYIWYLVIDVLLY